MPFQVDLVIAVKSSGYYVENKNDESSDDDDDDQKQNDIDDQNKNNKKPKNIGDIKQRLKDNESGYVSESVPFEVKDTNKYMDWWPVDDDEKEDIAALVGIARLMGYQYKKFHDVLSQKKKGNDGYKFDETYPQKKRFQIFVDRRNEDNEENK